MGPELFENGRPTKDSDCYALGMVIYEIIGGRLPFHRYPELTISTRVVGGERPPRGSGFTESLWKMLEKCWASEPSNRPSIQDVLQCLERVSNSSESPSPGVDEAQEVEVEESGDDWGSTTDSSGTFFELVPLYGVSQFHCVPWLQAYRCPLTGAYECGLFITKHPTAGPQLVIQKGQRTLQFTGHQESVRPTACCNASLRQSPSRGVPPRHQSSPSPWTTPHGTSRNRKFPLYHGWWFGWMMLLPLTARASPVQIIPNTNIPSRSIWGLTIGSAT